MEDGYDLGIVLFVEVRLFWKKKTLENLVVMIVSQTHRRVGSEASLMVVDSLL